LPTDVEIGVTMCYHLLNGHASSDSLVLEISRHPHSPHRNPFRYRHDLQVRMRARAMAVLSPRAHKYKPVTSLAVDRISFRI